mgnify:CR=1 FL=1
MVRSDRDRRLQDRVGEVMTEATQRPWAQKSSAWGNPQIAGANGKRIVELLTRPADKEFGFTDEARANAELIVKAVNNHDALVAALESALRIGQIASKPVIARIEAVLEQVK